MTPHRPPHAGQNSKGDGPVQRRVRFAAIFAVAFLAVAGMWSVEAALSDFSSLLTTDGAACADLRASASAAAGQYYFRAATASCVRCPNSSYYVHTPYIQALRPINLRALAAATVGASAAASYNVPCFCDASLGFATGTYVSDAAARGVNLTTTPPSLQQALSARVCTDCAALGRVPSLTLDAATGAQGCARCGTVREALALPSTAAALPAELVETLADAVYWSNYSGACHCPVGYATAESVGGVSLPFQLCVRCSGTVSAQDPSVCVVCAFPEVRATSAAAAAGSVAATGCACAVGYLRVADGSCHQEGLVNGLLAGRSGLTTVTPLNMNNDGTAGEPVPSAIMRDYLSLAAVRCSDGSSPASCNLLANLCVLASYSLTSAPCAAYQSLLATEQCRGISCEVPQRLPWLYYLRSSTSIFQDTTFTKTVALEETLRFVATAYAWNGTYLGTQPIVAQLHTCEMASQAALDFFSVGAQRRVTCNINIPRFVVAEETVFYDLFIIANDGELFPVPVLADYGTDTFEPASFGDSRTARAAARSDLTPAADAFRRRFYLYDNIGGRENINAKGTSYVTFARNVRIMVVVRPGHASQIYVPLLIIQYASKATVGVLARVAPTVLAQRQLQQVRTLDESTGDTLPGTTSSSFGKDTAEFDQTLMIVVIVVCIVCVVSAWARTYGWMRRQQDLLLGLDALGRFVLYYLNHVANLFFAVVLLACAFVYILFKNQASVEYMLPVGTVYLFACLYTAVAAKGVVCLARLVEQCNADVFVIDWERSKGQLLREGRDCPVSMWRSTFIANELNEMQTLRHWRPLFTILIALLFMEGLGYMQLSRAVPSTTIRAADATSPTNDLLRIAIAAFFWLVVAAVLYVLEYTIYYRFLNVHPLRGFVDLCSVANISVMILAEPQWGYYIHGESIHAHSDVSVTEFQDNLRREAQGNMPARGLGGQDQCQTFEVFVGAYMRQYLYLCYADLEMEYQKALRGEAGPVSAGHHRKLLSFLTGGGGTTRTFTPETMAIKQRINDAFIQSVRGAEKALVAKFGLHQMLDFPPNILFMNGPFAGESMGKDIYFLDDSEHFGAFLMYGLDGDLFIFYVLLFLAIDTSLHSTFIAAVVVYVIDLLLVYYRGREGQANLGAKTLFDERFFL